MKPISVPPQITAMLKKGAAVAISISGGKDGQAMLRAVVTYLRDHNLKNEVFAVHADLGKMEWKESLPHCVKICHDLGVRLEIVQRPGGLLGRMRDRLKKLAGTGKPFWPSARERYCTSDTKRGPINKLLRRYPLVISAEGIRSQESSNRSTYPVCSLRRAISSTAYKGLDDLPAYLPTSRFAATWYPIFDWSEEDVWDSYGHTIRELEVRREHYTKSVKNNMSFIFKETALSGWAFHPAYVYGNQRVSCAICILATDRDIAVGAAHNPELLTELVGMEQESGFTFKNGYSLTRHLPAGHPLGAPHGNTKKTQ